MQGYLLGIFFILLLVVIDFYLQKKINKKGYEFFCIDNSFNENEFFNDSKILIIKFDTAMVFPSEILSKIPSSINNLNSANAIFTEEKQSFLYFKSNN